MMKFNVFLTVFCCLFLASCEHDMERDSDDYATAKERVAALKKEIVAPSDFSDCEFELFNVNGFSDSRVFLPGSSSSRYMFVVKVKPKDISKWKTGLISSDSITYDRFWEKLIENRPQKWATTTKPKMYAKEIIYANNEFKTLIYEEEGIICRIISRD